MFPDPVFAPESLTGVLATETITVNLWSALRDSDLVGLLCLVALLCFSLYSWTIIIAKWRSLRRIESENQGFLRACGRDGTLETAFLESKRFRHSVLANILRAAYLEIHSENWFSDCDDLGLHQRLEFGRASIERAVERAINDQAGELDTNMTGLGTTTVVCPFIGLFGTVWGILAAFQAISVSGGGDIKALAPGISTALTTTIGGLLAAIPAVISFNIFATRIQKLTCSMESYALDLRSVFQREMIRRQSMRVAA